MNIKQNGLTFKHICHVLMAWHINTLLLNLRNKSLYCECELNRELF